MPDLRLALALVFAAVPATAPASSLDDEIAAVAADFDAAIRGETILPFLQPFEHPAIAAANAAHLGTDPDTYRARAATGYEISTAQSDIRAHRIFDQNIARGQSDGIAWAILPYLIDVDLHEGSDPGPQCNRLLIFRQGGKRYLAALVSDTNQRLVSQAIPALAEPLRLHPATCAP